MNGISSFRTALSSFFTFLRDQTPESVHLRLHTQEEMRVRQIKNNREWYSGKQYPLLDEDGSRKPYANLAEATVEKMATWLSYKMPVIKFREDIHTILNELAIEIIENSGGKQLYYESLMEGGISGDCFLYTGYDQTLNEGRGGVSIKWLPSDQTFVEYRNIAQKKEINKVMIQWDELTETDKVQKITEIWEDNKVTIYPKNTAGSLLLRAFPVEMLKIISGDDDESFVLENPYGELPFVHIKNLPTTDSVYGKSDLHHQIPLNREMNESFQSYKENVDYTGNPVTLLFGLSAKTIEKGGGRVWGGLPTNAKVESLSMESAHPQILEYFKILEKYTGLNGIPFHLLNALPDASFSDVTNMGLHLKFLPIKELAHRKKIFYENGFKQALEKGLRFVNKFLLDGQLTELNGIQSDKLKKLLSHPSLIADLEKSGNSAASVAAAVEKSIIGKIIKMRQKPFYELEFKFQDMIAENRMYTLMDLDVMLRNKLESIRGAMRTLDVEDPEAKLNEILEDLKMTATFDAMYQTMATPQTPETVPYSETAAQIARDNLPGGGNDMGGDPNAPEAAPGESPQNVEATTGQNAVDVVAKSGGL